MQHDEQREFIIRIYNEKNERAWQSTLVHMTRCLVFKTQPQGVMYNMACTVVVTQPHGGHCM